MITPNPLKALLSGLDLSALVPRTHAHFEPLLRDGFEYFLQALNPDRRRTIIAEQLSLAATAGTPARLARLLQSCPTLHKLGQLLARDSRLSPDIRRALQQLESAPPSGGFAELETRIRSEIGEVAGLQLADHALAEASVATVVEFTWRRIGAASQAGVFKVLKPGVEERLDEELAIWRSLAAYLEQRSRDYGLPAVDYREIIEAMTRHLHREVQFDRERQRLQWAADFYAGSPGVLIPELLPLGSPRLTAMERIQGSRITNVRTRPAGGGWRLADRLARELLARPFFSRRSRICVHADPHPGNLLLTPDGRIAILDWCQVVELDRGRRRDVLELVLGALSLDADRICRTLLRMAGTDGSKAAIRACVREALGTVSKGTLPGAQWLLRLFDALVMSRALRFDDNLLLLRKGLHNLNAVLDSLYPGFPLDMPLLQHAGTQLLHEWPQRLLSMDPGLRPGVPVSASDLFALWSAMPLACGRAWVYNSRPLLGAGPDW